MLNLLLSSWNSFLSSVEPVKQAEKPKMPFRADIVELDEQQYKCCMR